VQFFVNSIWCVIIFSLRVVHVSTCGSHLVGLLHNARLVILYGFERVLRGEIALQDAAVYIQLGPPSDSQYLAFENGRIAAATAYGVFVLSPRHDTDEPRNSSPSAGTLISGIDISRAMSFNHCTTLGNISCLQMTDTGLFLTWDPDVTCSLEVGDFATYNRALENPEYHGPDDEAKSTVFGVDFVQV